MGTLTMCATRLSVGTVMLATFPGWKYIGNHTINMKQWHPHKLHHKFWLTIFFGSSYIVFNIYEFVIYPPTAEAQYLTFDSIADSIDAKNNWTRNFLCWLPITSFVINSELSDIFQYYFVPRANKCGSQVKGQTSVTKKSTQTARSTLSSWSLFGMQFKRDMYCKRCWVNKVDTDK